MANLTDKLVQAEKINAQAIGVMIVVGVLAREATKDSTMVAQNLALRVIAQVCSPPHMLGPEDQ